MEKLAKLMFKLFHGRRDTWAAQRTKAEGGIEYFRMSGKEITVETYAEHLAGATIGLYPLVNKNCFFAAVDIDSPNLELVKHAAALVPQPNYIERSRSGNHHIWMFFNEPVAVESLAIACREALKLLKKECSDHCNLYPLRAQGLGMLIALPLQHGCVTSNRSVFIDATPDLESQYVFLRDMTYTKAPGSFLDDKKLKALWEGKGKTKGDTSQSGYDFSFCLALLSRGYSHDTTEKLLSKRPGLHLHTDGYVKKTVEAAAAMASKRAVVSTGAVEPEHVVDWDSIEVVDRKTFLERLGTRLVLHAPQLLQFDMFFATIMANLKTKGRPVWLLFVGPPGCGKTLPMMAIRFAPCIYMTSAFRPTALISGYGHKGGEDMSLIPKLHNKILVVKDMSSLLSQHKEVVAEVLGLLRDAYDGSCSRPFGTGVLREYTSRFGFIGATTPDIDAHWSLNVRLGERFLRFRCRATPEQIYEKIDRALDGLSAEESVDLEIENLCLGYLKYLMTVDDTDKPLHLSHKREIGRLAQLGAVLRTVVSRNPYGQEVLVVPEWEEATRYAKQLAKMALGLAYVRGKPTNGLEEMEDLKCLIRDAMDARIEKICKIIYNKPGLEASEIASIISLPVWTVRSCLDNLAVSRVVYHQRNSYKLTWYFVPWLAGQVNKFKLWPKEPEKGEQDG